MNSCEKLEMVERCFELKGNRVKSRRGFEVEIQLKFEVGIQKIREISSFFELESRQQQFTSQF